MHKWKCILADNEPSAIDLLKGYVEALEYMELTGICNNPFQVNEILNTHKVDLIILDINMPNFLGTQLFKTFHHPPKVIFTSTRKDDAFEAFELDAIDYLLKPVSAERFLKAVNRFFQINAAEMDHYNNSPGFLYFRAERKIVKVYFKDIVYIESFKDYVVIHRQNENELKVKYAIGNIENKLPQNLFLRIHRSFIVSVKKVTAFTNHDVELGKIELPIGKSYPDVFKKLIGNNFLYQPLIKLKQH